jgi:hypothetical protein
VAPGPASAAPGSGTASAASPMPRGGEALPVTGAGWRRLVGVGLVLLGVGLVLVAWSPGRLRSSLRPSPR